MSRFSDGREALRALGRRLRRRSSGAPPGPGEEGETTRLMGSPPSSRPPIAGPQEPASPSEPSAQPRPTVPSSPDKPRTVPRWQPRRPSLGFLHNGRPHLPRRLRRGGGGGGDRRGGARAGGARAALDRAVAAVRLGLAAAGRTVSVVGRDLGDAFRRLGRAWVGLDVYVRRRIGVVAAAVAVVLAFVLLAVPALPCQYPGGDVCPPTDDAAKLVPADALAYVHVDVNATDEQYRLAAGDLARVPLLSGQVLDRLLAGLPGRADSTVGFGRTVRPWLGPEAALALLPAGGAPQEVELLSVSDAAGAVRYQRSFAGPGAAGVTYRATRILVGRGGIASTVVHGFLVIGTRIGVRAVIETATGAPGVSSLGSSASASEVRAMLPSQRVADAYLSPAGTQAIAGRPTGLLASLAPFVAPRATRGVAVGLIAADGSLKLEIRSALDPKRARARPGFFAALPPFEATLASELPPSTLAYIGIGEPGRAIESLLGQASSEEPGLARAISALLQRIRSAAQLAVRRDLLPALGKEGALALEAAPPAPAPVPKGGGKPSRIAPIPGLEDSGTSRPPSGSPYLLYLGGGIDEAKARPALARLQVPLANALGAGAAGFEATRIAGVPAETLASPASPLDLTYAFVDGRLVVATNPAGVGAIARGSGGLGSTSGYRAATAGFPSTSSLLAYLDLRGLFALGEQAGLAQSPAFQTFSSDIHHLTGLGLSVAASPDSLATDARLVIAPGGSGGGGD